MIESEMIISLNLMKDEYNNYFQIQIKKLNGEIRRLHTIREKYKK